MLFYREDGEVIQDARIGFNTDPGEVTQIRQVAIIEDRSIDLRTYPAEGYIIEVEQPFWISLDDHVYLNPEFAYGADMIEWIRGFIADRTNVPVEFRMTHLDSLGGAIELSGPDLGRYLIGRPVWRRGALSCAPSRGRPRSALSTDLSKAIYAQLVVADLVAKVAIQLVRKKPGSRFLGKSKGACSALAGYVLSRALGYYPGTTKATKGGNEHVIGDRALGVERLIFGDAAYCFDDAMKEPAGAAYKELYRVPRGNLEKLIRSELLDFTNTPRSFNEHYDPSALVAWSASTLLALRIAFAASLDSDADRDFHKTILNEKTTDDERLGVARLDMINQFRRLEGLRDGHRVKLGVEQVLDLQYTAMVAFMANVNPTTLSPALDYGIRSDMDPETVLTPYLYLSAQWLGGLFRERGRELNAREAHALAGFANPDMLPSELPSEHREEWLVATRMMTSFMTEAGRVRLFEAAQAVLTDHQPRMIYLQPLARLQPQRDPAQVAATAKAMQKLRELSNSAIQLPNPVFAEAGWLVLPGNYSADWFEQSDPFEDTDFPG